MFYVSVARNAALSALVGGIAETVSALALSSASPPPAAASGSGSTPTAVSQGGDDDSVGAGGGKTKDYRMDVQDFVE
jgi:hypothetical protein